MPSDGARAVIWAEEPSRLDRALPEAGLVRSRSRAAELIAAGDVRVDGAVATKAGTRVATGSRIEISGDDHYVSRAAHKLVAGLDRFGVDPAGKIALDLGASTGGFTQVLLEHGVRAVQAIDVGRDQLVAELRTDPRVRLVEGWNARDLTREELADRTGIEEAPGIVVADLSFISLTLILPAIARCASEGADLVLLIKPQFEVGRVRDGVVTDPRKWAEAIRTVLASAAGLGFAARGLAPSPIAGGTGNREFLVHFQRGSAVDPTEWECRISELVADVVGVGRAEANAAGSAPWSGSAPDGERMSEGALR